MDPFNAKLVAAATGSTMTALSMTPFDVIKTRLQTQLPEASESRSQRPLARLPPNVCCQPTGVQGCVRNMSSLARPMMNSELVCIWEHGVLRTEKVNGIMDAARHVWKAEGLRGLWKGAGMSLVIGVPSSTFYMLTYDHLLRNVLPSLLPTSTFVPLTAGILARTAISSLTSPLELIRTNLQSTPISSDQPHTLRSVIRSIRTAVQHQGVSFLWRGLGPTLWRDVPFSGIYWASYEGIKGKLSRSYHRKNSASIAFVSGATSGTIAALITSPFDVLKTRRQALTMTSSSSFVAHSLPLMAKICREEGVSALYVGIMPRVAKIAPACGIMIACFEGIGSFLMKS